jgi:hypothetical protein
LGEIPRPDEFRQVKIETGMEAHLFRFVELTPIYFTD